MSTMPTWEGFLMPCLRALEDGATRTRREMSDLAANVAGLTDEQRAIPRPRGR